MYLTLGHAAYDDGHYRAYRNNQLRPSGVREIRRRNNGDGGVSQMGSFEPSAKFQCANPSDVEHEARQLWLSERHSPPDRVDAITDGTTNRRHHRDA
ncbi:hypothetical protein BBBOND_0201610 [Babesia bigemina]|uniref:Uncharacterized protein n=1 Tax=Babesia bigemina TaxID=5866 RepID=A0A061D7W1_BABBI|nr:hypothetical protein BBBOND_0201610 [Babesia bigemina]CDR95004.1 hypothetical protein BBBOND_0201610 [Babesia bigemina]|eukprot:XP_012767190.1 hypothetical protein BBBOND_0201610 [Babesia bigemina]